MSQEYETQRDINVVEKITVLVVEPMKAPYIKEISNELEALQKEVGGDIESVISSDESVELVCNALGKLRNLPPNRGRYNENGEMYDVIMGTFLIVGTTEDAYGSLTQEQVDKFMREYQIPEIFVNCSGHIHSVPAYSLESRGNGKRDTSKKAEGKGKQIQRRKIEHER